MALINQSVGKGGVNDRDDVKVVQRLLNNHLQSPQRELTVDGIIGQLTITAIEQFQSRIVGMRSPDGRVDPGGVTLRHLNRGPAKSAAPNGSKLSGSAWWKANQAKYPNSQRLEDLEGSFRDKCAAFLSALRAAGASVSIGATRRDKVRAHLMHYSWKIAHGQIRPDAVPGISGLDILWDHGNEAASRKAAQEMVDLFHMAFIASLTSNHIEGKAIDMTISWNGTLNIQPPASQSPVEIRIGPRNGDNPELQRVGEAFGVKKLRTDPPHWSHNGR